MLTRRKFFQNAAKLSAAMVLPARAVAAANVDLTLKLRKQVPVHVPADFMGLGYEMSSVAPLGLLSATNQRYVRLIQGLGRTGVLRVGGIVADYTRYDPVGTILADKQKTVVTRASLEQFAAFLNKIGWTAIWSVNFAQGSIDEAVAEARGVSSILGSRLDAIEIGNEVENYARGGRQFLKSPYEYEAYRKEYDAWRSAILNAVPGTRFAAPDTASSVEWVERMAQDAKGDVQLLTTHYYRNGQKRGSAEQLLLPDPHLKDNLARLRIASQQSGIPWRMCETNSFSGGGLLGVSNTFIGALWTLDFMLLLAEFGCAGVNIETGVNQLGFISPYSPIQDDDKGVNSAGVPYYGMLAFATAMADCHEVLPMDVDAQGANITAYALGATGKPHSIVIINRDGAHDAMFSLPELGLKSVSILRLSSPAPNSTAGVTLGGASVEPDGSWKARAHERSQGGSVAIPRISAVVLRTIA